MDGAKSIAPTGLNRYKADGVGMPFEVEPGHFDVFSTLCCKYLLEV
jgi:alpha,alpha-trehalase